MRAASDKILSRDQIAEICHRLKGEGQKIGFTSGAFDLLHAGHANYLERAKALCDVLVVGINTDESVRQYKGADRPIVPEQHRTQLVASLESVDYVFLFSERRNAQNIHVLQPDFYIKAGDYQKTELTSGELVEQYGGKVVLLPVQNDVSTSQIIRRIQELESGQQTQKAMPSALGKEQINDAEPLSISLDSKPLKMAPAVFLDRDGTINEEAEYLHEPEQFRLLPGAAEGMRRFSDMGYRIVVVTTQAGIGLGYFTKEDFYKTNRAMFRALAPFDVTIDRIYFCCHGKGENCDCRKPNTTLFERAAQELNLDLARSICIGDKTSDIEAGRRLGMTTILVSTGHAGKDKEYTAEPDHTAPSILDAAEWVLHKERE